MEDELHVASLAFGIVGGSTVYFVITTLLVRESCRLHNRFFASKSAKNAKAASDRGRGAAARHTLPVPSIWRSSVIALTTLPALLLVFAVAGFAYLRAWKWQDSMRPESWDLDDSNFQDGRVPITRASYDKMYDRSSMASLGLAIGTLVVAPVAMAIVVALSLNLPFRQSVRLGLIFYGAALVAMVVVIAVIAIMLAVAMITPYW